MEDRRFLAKKEDDLAIPDKGDRVNLSGSELSKIGFGGREIVREGYAGVVQQKFVGVLAANALNTIHNVQMFASNSFEELMNHHIDLARKYKGDQEKYDMAMTMMRLMLEDAATNQRRIIEGASTGVANIVTRFSTMTTPEDKRGFMEKLVSGDL